MAVGGIDRMRRATVVPDLQSVTQSEKFDPQGRFIKRYLPQLSGVPSEWIHAPWLAGAEQLQKWGVTLGKDYPSPAVDHAEARQHTLARFGK